MSSEHRNAFALSRMEFESVDSRVRELVRDGWFVVVFCTTAYCPFTDAILGERRTHAGHFAYRRQAEKFCAEQNASIGADTDCSCEMMFDIEAVNRRLSNGSPRLGS